MVHPRLAIVSDSVTYCPIQTGAFFVLGGADLGGGGDLTGGAGLVDLPLPAGVPGISVPLHSRKEIVLEETEGQVWLQVLVGAQVI